MAENVSWQSPRSEEDERAMAAGTGEAAHADDIRVAGPSDETPSDETPEDVPPAEADAAAEEPPVEATPAEEPPVEATPAEEPPVEKRLEQFMDPAAATTFRDRWREVQSSFVDDPKLAVEQAGGLASEVLDALSETLTERKTTLDGEWRTGEETPDTEKLRLALRGYRDFFDRMLSI